MGATSRGVGAGHRPGRPPHRDLPGAADGQVFASNRPHRHRHRPPRRPGDRQRPPGALRELARGCWCRSGDRRPAVPRAGSRCGRDGWRRRREPPGRRGRTPPARSPVSRITGGRILRDPAPPRQPPGRCARDPSAGPAPARCASSRSPCLPGRTAPPRKPAPRTVPGLPPSADADGFGRCPRGSGGTGRLEASRCAVCGVRFALVRAGPRGGVRGGSGPGRAG